MKKPTCLSHEHQLVLNACTLLGWLFDRFNADLVRGCLGASGNTRTPTQIGGALRWLVNRAYLQKVRRGLYQLPAARAA